MPALKKIVKARLPPDGKEITAEMSMKGITAEEREKQKERDTKRKKNTTTKKKGKDLSLQKQERNRSKIEGDQKRAKGTRKKK